MKRISFKGVGVGVIMSAMSAGVGGSVVGGMYGLVSGSITELISSIDNMSESEAKTLYFTLCGVGW